MLQEHWKTD